MNKKGFTLMEMLVSIVIIALITVLTFPNLKKIEEDNDKKMQDTYATILKSYADVYVNELLYVCTTSQVSTFFTKEFDVNLCNKISTQTYEFTLTKKGYEAIRDTVKRASNAESDFNKNYPNLESFFKLTAIQLKKIFEDNYLEASRKYPDIEEKIIIANKKTSVEIKL